MPEICPCLKLGDQCQRLPRTSETWKEAETHIDPEKESADLGDTGSGALETEVDPYSAELALRRDDTTVPKIRNSCAEASSSRPDVVLLEIARNCQCVGIDLNGACFERKLDFPWKNLYQGDCLSTKERRALLVGALCSGDIHMAGWDNHHIAIGPCAGSASESGRGAHERVAHSGAWDYEAGAEPDAVS